MALDTSTFQELYNCFRVNNIIPFFVDKETEEEKFKGLLMTTL